MAASRGFENWDDDLELEGPILTNSVSTYQNSISSRLSIRSESNAGDDDWNVSLAPNDEQSTTQAINSAKLAGIPIPSNVPSSALLGGAIKKLGNKKSPRPPNNHWDDDLELPTNSGSPLKVKKKEPAKESMAEDDDFDWTEGSLGIRHGGSRHASKTISPSFGLRSPSMGSIKTAESEEDGTGGLLLPSGPLDFEAALKKRQDAEPTTQSSTVRPEEQDGRPTSSRLDRDDSFDDIEFGPDNVFDPKKRTVNRNLRHQWKPSESLSPAQKSQTTLTFNDKAAGTRIPRPVPAPPARPSRLEPVLEQGATSNVRIRRNEPTTTNSQLLRSKRSAPALRQYQPPSRPAPMPSMAPSFNAQNRSAQARVPPYTHAPYGSTRRESDPNRAQSPTMRSHSRLSHAMTPDTPTRQRRDLAPAALAREAASKRQVTKPSKKRNFGDGSELDTFDDLPTSATKENLYMKQPTARGPPRQLRSQQSQSRLGLRDRMTTPLPPSTPKSPTKAENLPRFARDTAASRIAREQTINPAQKPKIEAPLMSRTNYSSTNLLRTPQTSPSAKRAPQKGPTLVAPMGKENIRHWEDDAAKKGMKWNPVMFRWEGNEKAIQGFDPPPPPSPPRPALITNFGQPASGALVSGNMVFDNQAKRWLKLGTAMSDPRSPSVGDDDDPFRDIEDLKDESPGANGEGNGGGNGPVSSGDWLVGEEFDVGPAFIQRQKEEETVWREKTGGWFGGERDAEAEHFKWVLRDIAANAPL